MITENSIRLSSAQTITASADSEDVYDSGAAGVLAGSKLLVYVGTAFATLTSLQVELQSSADNSSWVDHCYSPAILTASLTAGACVAQLLIPNGVRQYVKARYVVGGSNATTGTIYADIIPGDSGLDAAFTPATIAA